jgi:hypothetical protein
MIADVANLPGAAEEAAEDGATTDGVIFAAAADDAE